MYRYIMSSPTVIFYTNFRLGTNSVVTYVLSYTIETHTLHQKYYPIVDGT